MKFTVIVISLLVATCLSPTEAQNRNQDYLYYVSYINYISYIKDTKPEPDLCFAAINLGTNMGVLATVPCEAVEHLISNPSSRGQR